MAYSIPSNIVHWRGQSTSPGLRGIQKEARMYGPKGPTRRREKPIAHLRCARTGHVYEKLSWKMLWEPTQWGHWVRLQPIPASQGDTERRHSLSDSPLVASRLKVMLEKFATRQTWKNRFEDFFRTQVVNRKSIPGFWYLQWLERKILTGIQKLQNKFW